MRKLAIAAVVLLVLGALVAFAVLNLDRLVNRNKDYILAQAEQALGRKVAVKDIGVTLWGGIGVRLKDFALADDKAFSAQDFVRAGDLQVNVEFLPLLRKEVRVKRIILREPVVTVIRDTRGVFNFASLGGSGPKDPRPAPQGTPAPSPGALPLLVSLVDVADGEVRYLDKKDGIDVRIGRLDLTVKDLGADRPLTLVGAAAFLAERQNFKFRAELGPPRSPSAPLTLHDIPLVADVTLDAAPLAKLQRLPLVKAVLPRELTGEGPLSMSLHAEGTLENVRVTATADGTQSVIGFGEQFRKPQGTPLRLTADARVTPAQIDVAKADITLHSMELTGSGTITRGPSPVLRLALKSKSTDLNGWEKVLPVLQGYALAGKFELGARVEGAMAVGRLPDVNGSLRLSDLRAGLPQSPQPVTTQSATLTFTGQRAALAETSFRLGKSDVRLAAQAENFAPLSLTYRASAAELRPADLMHGRPATKKPELLREVKSDGRVWMEKGSLAARARISSPRGTISDLDYTDLQATLSLADQVLTIDPLAFRAYNGSLQGRGQYDLRMTPPRFTLTSQVRGMEVGQLLGSWSDITTRHLRGTVTADLTLSGRGSGWDEIQRGLSGQGAAEITQGALLDANIAEGALTGLTSIPGLSMFISPRVRGKYPAIFATRNTDFTDLKGTMTIKDGKMQLDNLLVAAADWTARGKGWVGLDRTVDMRATLALSPALSADLISDVKPLRFLTNKEGRVEIPLSLAGALPSVTPKPDGSLIARMLERQFIGRGIDELTKGLLKGKEQESPAPTAPAQPAQPAPPPEKKPEEELLKDLKRLFRR